MSITVERPIQTIADLITLVAALSKPMTPRRRAALKSALVRFAAFADADPTQLPADPPTLRRILDALESHPKLKARYLGQIRVQLGFALRAAGLGYGQHSPYTVLTAEYQRLLDSTQPRYAQYRLVRFFAYCSHLNVSAADIDQTIFDGFLDHLTQNTLTKKPDEIGVRTRRAWNYAARTVVGWPKCILRTTKRSGQPLRARLREGLPATLSEELFAFRSALIAGHAMDLHTRKLALSTAIEIHKQIARLARTLLSAHVPVQTCGELVAPETAAFALHLLYRRHGRRSPYLYAHACAICRLAEIWCDVPSEQLERLRRLRRKYWPSTHPAGRCLDVSSALLNPTQQEALIRLPRRFMECAHNFRSNGTRAALFAQVAIALELLLATPMLPKYLAALELGRTLVRTENVEGPFFRILIPGERVHIGQTLDYSLARESSLLIQQYVDEFWPRLKQEAEWLFPGREGKPKTAAKLSAQITAYVERAIGVHLTSLALRYFAGAMYLLAHPDHHEVVRQALGHKRLSSTHRMYRDLDAMLAATRFDTVVLTSR